jgi:AhpD family alkylhydroperoxidase
MGRIDEIIQERNDGHWNLTRFRSKVYDAFQAVEEAAFADGALTTKAKELIAVGISVQSNCESAMQLHIERAARQDATFEEALEAVEVGIEMGGGQAVAGAQFAFHVLGRLYPQEILRI